MASKKVNFMLLYSTTHWWILGNFLTLINAQSYSQIINPKYDLYRKLANSAYSNWQSYSVDSSAKLSVPTTTSTTIVTQPERASSNSIRNSKFLGIPPDVPENSKFLGMNEDEEQNEERFNHNHKHHKHHHKRRRQRKHQRPSNSYNIPCVAGRRNEDGRFLWDINIYNVFPSNNQQQSNGIECEDYGNTGSNGGDHYQQQQQQHNHNRPHSVIQGWNVIYNLIRPGGPLNPQRPDSSGSVSGSNGNRPSNSGSNSNNDGSNGDIYDPVYDDKPVYENLSNDFPTPRPFTPGEIVGSIANTVNGVIQTISGNRSAYYRTRRYF